MCGAPLGEEARFCDKCGTEIININEEPTPTPAVSTHKTPSTPTPIAPAHETPPTLRKDQMLLIAVGLVIILVLATAIVAFLVIPSYLSLSDNYRGSNLNKLDLNFELNPNKTNPTTQNTLQFDAWKNNPRPALYSSLSATLTTS